MRNGTDGSIAQYVPAFTIPETQEYADDELRMRDHMGEVVQRHRRQIELVEKLMENHEARRMMQDSTFWNHDFTYQSFIKECLRYDLLTRRIKSRIESAMHYEMMSQHQWQAANTLLDYQGLVVTDVWIKNLHTAIPNHMIEPGGLLNAMEVDRPVEQDEQPVAEHP